MTRADRVLSTPPTSTPIPNPIHAATAYRTPLRSYLFEGTAIAFILIAGGIVSSIIAINLMHGRVVEQCFQPKVLR